MSIFKNGLSISKVKGAVDNYNKVVSIHDVDIHKGTSIKSDYVDNIIDYLKDNIDYGVEDVVILDIHKIKDAKASGNCMVCLVFHK